jgi:hypothetical protein
MPDIETPDAPTPAPEPAPVAAPAAKALYLATADVLGGLAGSVWSLTAAQAATGGDALQPLTEDPAQRAFILAAWGRAPVVLD